MLLLAFCSALLFSPSAHQIPRHPGELLVRFGSSALGINSSGADEAKSSVNHTGLSSYHLAQLSIVPASTSPLVIEN